MITQNNNNNSILTSNIHCERISTYEKRFKNSLDKLNVPKWLNKDIISTNNNDNKIYIKNLDLELRKTKSEYNIKYNNNNNKSEQQQLKQQQQQERQNEETLSFNTSKESLNSLNFINNYNSSSSRIYNNYYDLKFQPKTIKTITTTTKTTTMITGDTSYKTKSTSNIILNYESTNNTSSSLNLSTNSANSSLRSTSTTNNSWYKPRELQLPTNSSQTPVIDFRSTNLTSNILAHTPSSEKLSINNRKMDENELGINEMSFEEKSELLEIDCLNDSNNFPPPLINYDSNLNMMMIQQHNDSKSSNNTLDNILTNSSSISNDIQIEIYDNLMNNNTNKKSFFYTSGKLCSGSGNNDNNNDNELREYDFESNKLTKHKTLYFNNNEQQQQLPQDEQYDTNEEEIEEDDDNDDDDDDNDDEDIEEDDVDNEENEDEFFLVQTDSDHNIIEEEPYYLNQDADNNNSAAAKLIRSYHQQYEINRLSNIIEEDDDQMDSKSFSENLKINIVEEIEKFNEDLNELEEEEEEEEMKKTNSTISESNSVNIELDKKEEEQQQKHEIKKENDDSIEESHYKSSMRKRSFDLGSYKTNNELIATNSGSSSSIVTSGNPILDILINKLNQQNIHKKSSPTIPHASTDSFERLEKKFQQFFDNEEQLYEIKTNVNIDDTEEVDTNENVSDYDDTDKFEENGKGYTVFYTEDNKPNEFESRENELYEPQPVIIESPSKNVAITALKIENKDDTDEDLDFSDLTTNEEEIILIGEKNDIKNLLSNDNHQLENLLMSKEKSKQNDLHYKHMAKVLVNDVVNTSVDRLNPTNALKEKDDIFEYYSNLEKSLLQVRSEIDALKQEAFGDLEFINDALKNEQEVFSEHEGDYVTPAQSFQTLMPPDGNNQFFSALNSMCEDLDATRAPISPSSTTSTCTLTNGNNPLTRPSVPPPQVPQQRETQLETIKKSKSINLQEVTTNIDLNNGKNKIMNKNDTLMHKSLHNLNSTTTTTTTTITTTNSNAINSTNQIPKKILDKCLKLASYNTSLFDLNLTTKQQTQEEEKQNEQQQNSISNKNSEKKFLTLQNLNKSQTDLLNEYRIPSSRHFCGRLLSTKIDQQENNQPNLVAAPQTQPRKSLKTIKNQVNETQKTSKMINSISQSNLSVNNNQKAANQQQLSKSTKDIRNFVSNSYSPSIIIKPPLASSSHHTVTQLNDNNNQRARSVDRRLDESQKQQSYPLLNNQKLNGSNFTHVNIDIEREPDDALLDSILYMNNPSTSINRKNQFYSSISTSNRINEEYDKIKNNYTNKKYDSVGFNKKPSNILHSQVIYKCDYLNCSRFKNEFVYLNDLSAEKDLQLKVCHYCHTHYCSKECRELDWEYHKMTKCYFGRLSSSCKRILSKIGRNLRLRIQLSKLANTGYLSTAKRGFIWLDFNSSKDAQEFLTSTKLPDFEKGFSEFLNYFGTTLLPKYVCFESNKNLLSDSIDILELRKNTAYLNGFNELRIETSELVIKELFYQDEYLDDYHKLNTQLTKYDPSNEFILLISIQINPQDIPNDLIPRKRDPYRRKYVLNFMKLKFVNNTESCDFNATIQSSSLGTLILTSLKSDSTSEPEDRQLFMANLLTEFELRGINLKQKYPRLYSNLCSYVEHSRPLTPLCLFPRDLNRNNLFMCLIVPNSEQAINDWVYESKNKLEGTLNLKDYMYIV